MLAGREAQAIVSAIRNHEAFHETETIEDDMGSLVSGALYDADKFRWGPDNFTATLWDIIEDAHIDIRYALMGYQKGMEGIGRIRETFRTETGKKYGPEFIDIGILLGKELYEKLLKRKGSDD